MILLIVADIDGVTVAAIKTEPRCSVKAGPSLTKRTGSTKISEVYIHQ